MGEGSKLEKMDGSELLSQKKKKWVGVDSKIKKMEDWVGVGLWKKMGQSVWECMGVGGSIKW